MTAPTPPPVPASPGAAGSTPATSGLAIASLICGLFGFLCLPAIAGLICGIIASREIRKSGGRRKGAGLAIAGIVLSSIFICLSLISIPAAMLLPALARAKSKAQTIASMSNMKQLCLAAHLYASDHKDQFPSAESWSTELSKYVGSPKVFQSPDDTSGARSSYGFNSQVAGRTVADVNRNTVLFFELDQGGWNITGGRELARQAVRGNRPMVVGFADGHVEVLPRDRFSQVRWEP